MKKLSHHSIISDFKLPASLGFAVVMGLGAFVGSGSASTINGTLNGLTPYFNAYDLEEADTIDGAPTTPTDDWVIYGGIGGGGSVDDFTSKLNSSSFGVATYGGSGTNVDGGSGRVKFAHDGGFGDYPTATSSVNANGIWAQGGAPFVTFTHTMLGTAEELDIYLFSRHNSSMTVDLSASLGSSGGSYSVTDVTLPSASANYGDLGILSLNISGATVGETLTFTIATDLSEQSGSSGWWGVGLAGATATVIPEPGTFALLSGVFGLAFVMLRRRK